MKKVLIFGCGGFVGKYLAEEFFNHGYQVIGTGIGNPTQQVERFVSLYSQGNILDSSFVENLIEEIRPDFIVNLAAISSVGNSWRIPQETISVNVNGTINILESVKKIDIDSKILLIGSSEEYISSDKKINEDFPIIANNPYGISKVTQEHFAKLYRNEYGMKVIITRTFNHTGVGQPVNFAIPSFVKQAANIHNSKSPGIMKVGNLGAYRDLGDVRDMVSAYRMILESDTEEFVFNVGSGNCYCLKDIVEYITSLSGQNIEICIDKDKLRPLDNPIIWCDNSKLKREIGWAPQYTVYDAINLMFEDMTQ